MTIDIDLAYGAAIALISGVVGAFFQAVVGRRSDYIKSGRQARYAAYADYITGIALLSHGQRATDPASALALVADARGRIALYGSAEVIAAMNRVFRHGSDLSLPAARRDLVSMLSAMRADVIWIDPKVPDPELADIVFGNPGVDREQPPALTR